jgi:hypothetical protein
MTLRRSSSPVGFDSPDVMTPTQRVAAPTRAAVSGNAGEPLFHVGRQVTFRGHLTAVDDAVTVTVVANIPLPDIGGGGRHDLVLRPDSAADWARLVGILTPRLASVDGHPGASLAFRVEYLAPTVPGNVPGGWDDVGVVLVES